MGGKFSWIPFNTFTPKPNIPNKTHTDYLGLWTLPLPYFGLLKGTEWNGYKLVSLFSVHYFFNHEISVLFNMVVILTGSVLFEYDALDMLPRNWLAYTMTCLVAKGYLTHVGGINLQKQLKCACLSDAALYLILFSQSLLYFLKKWPSLRYQRMQCAVIALFKGKYLEWI